MATQMLSDAWKNGWNRVDDETKTLIDAFACDFMSFLDSAKTERLAVREVLKRAQAHGFQPIDSQKSWTPGACVYLEQRGKGLVLARLGKKMPTEGLHMSVAHVDAPRLDLKVRPLRQDEEFAVLETHYYGGIRKYQWLSTPLALHGVVVRLDGSVVEISIGNHPDDPVLVIPDLLPHLARKAVMPKSVEDAFKGEDLDLISASMPLKDEEKEAVKKQVLHLLDERFSISEADLLSAEIEIVPAGFSRHVGLDRSMVGGYGQDDRICAYATAKALFDLQEIPEHTSVVVLCDKEEIGSFGSACSNAAFVDRFVEQLVALASVQYNSLDVHKMWYNSRVISADVNVGVDPIWKSVHESTNAARLGYGVVVSKYLGSGGKSGTNDANAEFMGFIRRIFEQENVIWQIGELGRVDEGGGGTVSKDFARRGAEVIDCGVPLLGMHSLFEVSSKLDLYFMYKASVAFFTSF